MGVYNFKVYYTQHFYIELFSQFILSNQITC